MIQIIHIDQVQASTAITAMGTVDDVVMSFSSFLLCTEHSPLPSVF